MRLTVKDLIAKRLDKEKVLTKEIHVPSLGGTLNFEKPSKENALILLEASLNEGQNVREFYEAFKKTVYDCCPDLKSNELHEEYGIKDPYDIVEALFEVDEIIQIGGELALMSGVTVEKVDEAIKNS